jgi:hypothetical protein
VLHCNFRICLVSQFHIFGLVVVLFGGLVRGSRVIVMAKFEPMPFLETLAKYALHLLYSRY